MSSRTLIIGAAIALVGFATAQAAHVALISNRETSIPDPPFAPSPTTAPFVSLGYREVTADLLFVRMIGYFGGNHSTASGIADLAEAIATLDPARYRVYEFGARAMELATFGVDRTIFLRAIALLDRGRAMFPKDWRLPYVEGSIYTQDLQTPTEVANAANPPPAKKLEPTPAEQAQRRAWDEKGTMLIESSIRKPHAPQELATWASVMRTKLGQYDRAVTGLREMLLVSHDDSARANILAKLAELENKSDDAVGIEVLAARADFEQQWQADRPALPATMYLLLGKHPSPHLDLGDLATGGHAVFEPPEHLAPPTD